ncbi:Regulator of chromosome condensation (RCC1) family protein [Zostera marina]|uniref:Regulator of chromosome condensation (RCC1) family protein n=1 Tax=Zostera marina TaxID=29655 RepID=A0A0K9P0B4_ZOSMR|nr:Regulator of chromosome condensation (RCC1) family protein [Zostera marina]
MQGRVSNGDGFRMSVSSAISSSSQGSGPDDCESLGDVYVWGEIWCDSSDITPNSICTKTDVLLPKSLESNVVLDVHQISCGVSHAALVTRQGEVFTWGEEFGGRLGLGTDTNASKPRFVELMTSYNVEFVTCGEYHTCAVSVSGDLFTWGDGTRYTGLLGHGTDVSHWIPKRVTGVLEGIQVISVATGTWHSAFITSHGKLFTFGDGSFGVLGHGDRENILYPREVETLSSLRTIKVACGVWHTAAIIDMTGHVPSNVLSRKLFTWGDGDKYRLGHGDKDTKLVPTCVSYVIEFNFNQVACGHSITVGLTTAGRIFTVGSTSYGQLGAPHSDGKLPCMIHDKLSNELVEDVACGSYHIVVLTSRSEVFTWGKGENGRLGLGDTEDRKTPTFVEALKDRHVKSISCGSNFTASVCIHKWVSGADQSVCSGCRQAFGFTRQRHNCYNCGLVHCHACSSKKILRAALAPAPGKPHRVCDSCYTKSKSVETGSVSTIIRKQTVARHPTDTSRDRVESRHSKYLFLPILENIKYMKFKPAKSLRRSDHSLSQLKEIPFPAPSNAMHEALASIVSSQPSASGPITPRSRKSSSSHGSTQVFSKSAIDSLKQTNDFLNQELSNLQTQVKTLNQNCEIRYKERQNHENKARQAALSAAKESYICINALEIVKSIAEKVKNISEKISLETNGNLKVVQVQVDTFLNNYDQKSGSFRDSNDPRSPSTYDPQSPSTSDPQSPSTNLKPIVEQFEPGVYVTVIPLQDGTKLFKHVKFSKRRFAAQQAEDWWKDNQERVLKKYAQSFTETSSSLN